MATLRIRRGLQTSQVSCEVGQSLLDAAAQNGVLLPSSCRRGDCGLCAAELLTGSVAALVPELPSEREGKVLLCNAAPCGDVELQVPWFEETSHLRVLKSPCKIASLQRLGDVLDVRLRVPPALKFNYAAGQFVRLMLPDGLGRSYSLAQAPATDGLLRIQVRRVDGGAFSRYLFELAKPGDLLRLEGPHGQFFLREHAQVQQTVFLATGTGIAPIFAMLESLADARREALRSRCGQLHVYWGNRLPEDAYLLDDLRILCADLGASLTVLASRAAGLQSVGVRYVQHAMQQDLVRLDDAQVYACGNPTMIAAAQALALTSGLPPERFYSDPFTAS